MVRYVENGNTKKAVNALSTGNATLNLICSHLLNLVNQQVITVIKKELQILCYRVDCTDYQKSTITTA